MIYSMPAFARAEQAGEHGTLSWEIRSVNHRYLEPHLRLPESFRDLEGAIREALRKGLSRGKVECTLRFAEDAAGRSMQVDHQRAGQLIAAAESVAAMINERLDAIGTETATLRSQVPQMLAAQRQKLLDRCVEMRAELDPQRLEQELVMLAQKSDVAEEIDRLGTHVTEVRRVLKSGGAAGRRLDFLMQELNREANTLGSKAFDTRSTQAAVNLKVLIEQMREQVQNIE